MVTVWNGDGARIGAGLYASIGGDPDPSWKSRSRSHGRSEAEPEKAHALTVWPDKRNYLLVENA